MGCGCSGGRVAPRRSAQRAGVGIAPPGPPPMMYVVRCSDGFQVFDDVVSGSAEATRLGCPMTATRYPPVA